MGVAPPEGAGEWSVRRILTHLVEAQWSYVKLLTLPPSERTQEDPLPFERLEEIQTTDK